MKWIAVVVASFALGVVVTAMVCREIRAADRTAYKSDVVAPTAQVLSEINADIQGGETNRAVAKLILLEKRLGEFIYGGPSPEVFISEIRKVEDQEANNTPEDIRR